MKPSPKRSRISAICRSWAAVERASESEMGDSQHRPRLIFDHEPLDRPATNRWRGGVVTQGPVVSRSPLARAIGGRKRSGRMAVVGVGAEADLEILERVHQLHD